MTVQSLTRKGFDDGILSTLVLEGVLIIFPVCHNVLGGGSASVCR